MIPTFQMAVVPPTMPPAQVQKLAIQNYIATTTDVQSAGGIPLFVATDKITQFVEFVNGVPVDSFWNMTANPNVEIPESVFTGSGFVLDGPPLTGTTILTTKDTLLEEYVNLGAVPETIAELLTQVGAVIPLDTKYVEVLIDATKLVAGDFAKYGKFTDVTAQGIPFTYNAEFDTPTDIAGTKFVAVPTLANTPIKCFITCYSAKN